MPVLLGQGRRLIDNLSAQPIGLQPISTLTAPDVDDLAQRVTHLRYRVGRGRLSAPVRQIGGPAVVLRAELGRGPEK